MKETYQKPEARCLNADDGSIIATSEVFAEKSKSLVCMQKDVKIDMEDFKNSSQTTSVVECV